MSPSAGVAMTTSWSVQIDADKLSTKGTCVSVRVLECYPCKVSQCMHAWHGCSHNLLMLPCGISVNRPPPSVPAPGCVWVTKILVNVARAQDTHVAVLVLHHGAALRSPRFVHLGAGPVDAEDGKVQGERDRCSLFWRCARFCL